MIILIDNYDSFTYNVVQYLSELGADLAIYRNDEMTVESIVRQKPDAIVLSPGPGRPEKAGMMNELVKTVSETIPVLGICLGHQSVAQVLGATIGYAPVLMHGKTSQINHDGSELYATIPNPFVATRYHSLVLERESLPKELKVTAWTDDNVIMGIRHKTLPLFGVQFHPESIMTPDGKTILKNFLDLL